MHEQTAYISRLSEELGLVNVRDVADAHASLRAGVLYRGCCPKLTPQGAERFQQALGCQTVIDLRTQGEITYEPCAELPGASQHNIPIVYGLKRQGVGLYQQILNHMLDDACAEDIVTQAFVSIVSEQWDAVLQVLALIASSNESIYIHCRHGRDRTGIIEAILLRACNVPYADILHSFLLSNIYMKEKNLCDFARMSEGMDEKQKKQLWVIFETREQFLQCALDAAVKPLDSALLQNLQMKLIR